MSAVEADVTGRDVGLDPVAIETTALLIIDMSNDFLAPGAPMETVAGRAIAGRLAKLANRCRMVGVPVVHVNHVHHPGAHDMGSLGRRFPSIARGEVLRGGTPGVEIWHELAVQPRDVVVEKIRQSGFVYTSLEAVLRELGAQTLIVSGTEVGACVECTARDAVARDFEVIMLSDGTAASDLPDLGWGAIDRETLQRVFLTTFATHFGRVATIAQVLESLAEASSTGPLMPTAR